MEMVWHPKMNFQNVLDVEKIRGFGYEELHEYYITYPNKIQMIENLKVTISCNFDHLEMYPFEKHECDLGLYDKIYTEESLVLKPPALVFYKNQYISITNDTTTSMLLFSSPRISFKTGIKINPPSIYMQYNLNRYSVSGIKLIFWRNSLGLLIGRFYIPTAIFAIMSMASFVINPNVVSMKNKLVKNIVKLILVSLIFEY